MLLNLARLFSAKSKLTLLPWAETWGSIYETVMRINLKPTANAMKGLVKQVASRLHKPPKKDHTMTIYEHVRNYFGRRIGTLVATKQGEQVVIGWSKCTRTDKFSSAKGREIALTRATRNRTPSVLFPLRLCKPVAAFACRAARYFKTDKVALAGLGEIQFAMHISNASSDGQPEKCRLVTFDVDLEGNIAKVKVPLPPKIASEMLG